MVRGVETVSKLFNMKEIWFKCLNCGRESYCEKSMAENKDQEVFCPFCHKVYKLVNVQLNLPKS